MPHPNDPANVRPGGPADPDAELERELAALRAEYETWKDEKVRTEQNLANIRQQLGELETRATADYGTAEVGRLTALLEEKRRENARLVEEYRAHILSIQKGLADLDRQDQGQ